MELNTNEINAQGRVVIKEFAPILTGLDNVQQEAIAAVKEWHTYWNDDVPVTLEYGKNLFVVREEMRRQGRDNRYFTDWCVKNHLSTDTWGWINEYEASIGAQVVTLDMLCAQCHNEASTVVEGGLFGDLYCDRCASGQREVVDLGNKMLQLKAGRTQKKKSRATKSIAVKHDRNFNQDDLAFLAQQADHVDVLNHTEVSSSVADECRRELAEASGSRYRIR